MTLRIQRNSDGSLKVNHGANTVDMFCDVCGGAATSVSINGTFKFIVSQRTGLNEGISLNCSDIGGSCTGSTCCWPIANGTADAQALATEKTA